MLLLGDGPGRVTRSPGGLSVACWRGNVCAHECWSWIGETLCDLIPNLVTSAAPWPCCKTVAVTVSALPAEAASSAAAGPVPADAPETKPLFSSMLVLATFEPLQSMLVATSALILR